MWGVSIFTVRVNELQRILPLSHEKVKSVTLPETRCAFVTAASNQVWQKWYSVTSETVIKDDRTSSWCSFSFSHFFLLTLETQLPDWQEAQVTWRKYMKEFQLSDSLWYWPTTLYTTARHVSEEALKTNWICCSSNCCYVRDSRQDHPAEHSESPALREK